MTYIVCTDCNEQFDPTNYLVTSTAGVAGAGVGAYWGTKIGLALGPLGAISGMIPGAILGSLFGAGAASKVAKCPHCDSIMNI